ncbi:MAG: FMN-binding negative transcriptional regulator [Bdellovibrionaceae bacterium]|nr:FMN-binding negative transcriptional regulator [Pseudobdellovibrionaceae bacterium]
MIYLPKRFQNENTGNSLKLIEEYPLATLISIQDSSPFFSHIPLVVESNSDQLVLIGHIAKGNPHWRLMNEKPINVIFNGPNEYISPKWYIENDAPTWNYAVVHIEGHCSLIESLDGILDCLKKLSNASEGKSIDPWEFWIPEDLAAPGLIEKSIVGFKIEVQSLKAKFKLNQSRSEADLNGVIKGLEAKGTDSGRKVAALMKTSWYEYNRDQVKK